jgi:hypothetical protein
LAFEGHTWELFRERDHIMEHPSRVVIFLDDGSIYGTEVFSFRDTSSGSIVG